jgi:tRNA (cmo5U34)-methyltransferase
MIQPADTNAAIWKSGQTAQTWVAEAQQRERNHAARWQFMAELLPFDEHDTFTFLDLGAGTGGASRAVLRRYPSSSGVLADFSAAMMRAGEDEMRPFAGRYSYVEFDMLAGDWPPAIPPAVDAVISSLCVHHLPDERKQGLFSEILGRLVPLGWYLNYDPIRTDDAAVATVWQRVTDRDNPDAAHKRHHRTPQEQARYENHIRFIIPLEQQLQYLRSAGFQGVDVYYKRLDYVIYGGCRPA